MLRRYFLMLPVLAVDIPEALNRRNRRIVASNRAQSPWINKGEWPWMPPDGDGFGWSVNWLGPGPWPITRWEIGGHSTRACLLWGHRQGRNGIIEFMEPGFALEVSDGRKYIYSVYGTKDRSCWSVRPLPASNP